MTMAMAARSSVRVALASGRSIATRRVPAACPAAVPARGFFSLPDLGKFSPFSSPSSSSSSTAAPTTATTSLSSDAQTSKDFEIHTEKVTLPYPRQLLFNIVQDVDRYQEFVPYCLESSVRSGEEEPESAMDGNTGAEARSVLADLTVGYKTVQETYTSRVDIVQDQLVRATALPHPLFRHLETVWAFTSPSPDSRECQVEFSLAYAFSSPVYGALAKAVMQRMATEMVSAFEKRAAQLSG
ncbi:hypothetical protein FA10DRAFT_303281 [Acaromyces ingoldii]|uniref:Coenzyme Q-binding protein COQ10 START domain-containing protein n=1 Tax=Acaromyces ingoldii TaxID=215250 RepID=A0A316YGK9_9BASI|nr:hypothetical protein FA10DRAFT_303281 [Acaromyces ingoldii]PWN88302.1 hypothetical protein FA10DRAFT_303281 [Acaromyces ingoldii]